MEFNFDILSFHDLNTLELYEILKLRSDIFVVEQNCVYSDMDNKDISSFHCLLSSNKKVVGYARILPSGLSYDAPSIGRVVIHPDFRGKKLAYHLMRKCMEFSIEKFKTNKIIISAQSHLSEFYGNLGFVKTGQEYLEDGIPHCKMFYLKPILND